MTGCGDNNFICLMTDFSDSDPFAAMMKGVIYSLCPSAKITDITHKIPQYGIEAASLILFKTYPFFPRGTVFAAVVDPEVGTKREIIVMESGGYRFTAPDNGILSYIYRADKTAKVVYVRGSSFFSQNVSSTFHGRDIFAPLAAHLSMGVPLERMGEEALSPVCLPERLPCISHGSIEGTVLFCDSFGNITTNIHRSLLENRRIRSISVSSFSVSKISSSYAEDTSGDFIAVINSFDFLEIALYKRSAADFFGRSSIKIKVALDA